MRKRAKGAFAVGAISPAVHQFGVRRRIWIAFWRKHAAVAKPK
jgi:hypothetical protein